ncbi:TPA: hypothetical protein U1B09_001139 [Streptococcus suis]|uniref:hypothetical protein n=1 Tax=Streptococcus TaxID=1301 RepID=UPI001961AC09|nr:MULTISPECIES: hypothetical protein [Streptococcus]MBM7135913.1 hypothetical protein [Streptococcus suis]MBY0730992.1 hypothetical protein [Streptococcus sp. 2018162]MCO8177805.1 hypothetical protein [Streptococcus suis]HEM3463638.1 hypothetical protein [Streptococcus suis]
MLTNVEIEQKELKYLKKFYHFLKYVEDEMIEGFNSKEKIRSDWDGKYGKEISEFAVGAERIVYALLNGRAFGTPNSNPVSSDMFFEVEDAFIHLDMKTVVTDNLGDITGSIFVGENQNSYAGVIKKRKGVEELYSPNIPKYYSQGTPNEKLTLSYFVVILSNSETLEVEMVSIMCMPNGQLHSHYGSRPLQAGKNPGKARFKFSECDKFELLNNESRIMVSYVNKKIPVNVKERLKFFFDDQLYNCELKSRFKG